MAYSRGHPPQGYSHKVLTQVDFEDHHDHYTRMIWDIFNPAADRTITLGDGDLHLTPVQIEFLCTVEAIGFITENPVSPFVRMGIYYDNGDTPVGGALIVQGGPLAPVVNQKNEVVVAATQLVPGLYWIAFISDGDCDVMSPTWQGLGGGTIVAYWSDNYGYGALPDPCPAADLRSNQTCTYLLVSGVPE